MSNELQEHVSRVLEHASIPPSSIERLVELWRQASETDETAALNFVAWLDQCGMLEHKGRTAIEYFARGYVDIDTASASLHVDRIRAFVDGTVAPVDRLADENARLDPAELRRRRDELLGTGARFGHYQIVEEIEFGCHGVSRLALEADTGRFVVIKALEESADEWIQSCANDLATRRVAAFPELVSADTAPFPHVVFDWAPGVSLEALVGRFGSLRTRAALHIALEVTQALAAMSATRKQHGSLCARNVQLLADSSLRVLDWGLSGAPSGYRAPELNGPQTTPASEIYSIGVLIFRLVMGYEPRRPRNGVEAHEILIKMLKAGHPRRLVDLLERCMAFDASDRVTTHAELVLILGRMLHEQVEEVEEEFGDLDDEDGVRGEIQKRLDWLDEEDGGFPTTDDDERRKKTSARKSADVRPEDVSTESTAFALDAMRDELAQSFRKKRQAKTKGDAS